MARLTEDSTTLREIRDGSSDSLQTTKQNLHTTRRILLQVEYTASIFVRPACVSLKFRRGRRNDEGLT